MKAAHANPSLIHQVIAPAGSTLLFFESLMHGSGIIRSDKDRLLIIGGYTPNMFQAWTGYDPDPEFLSQVDPKYRSFLDGSKRWTWQPKIRRDINISI